MLDVKVFYQLRHSSQGKVCLVDAQGENGNPKPPQAKGPFVCDTEESIC